MERNGPVVIDISHRRPTAGAVDDTLLRLDDAASRHDIVVISPHHQPYLTSPTLESPPATDSTQDDGVVQPSRDNCDRRRPEEEESRHVVAMPTQLVNQAVTPFLREHIPGFYAPVSKPMLTNNIRERDPNSRYCYRHRPDSKCRRAADESKMDMIQSELDRLPAADQQAITHVWSLFSAAPARHRDLMLQGIMTQCCFPQLSTVAREVQEQLKIDFLAALPTEISYKILRYLDTISLCKAAQVSRRWRTLADDDVVWHRMCEQHIDRKCTKCGWGLPLLERKRLRDWTRQQQLSQAIEATVPAPPSVPTVKRDQGPDEDDDYDPSPKRQRVNGDSSQGKPRVKLEQGRRFRPWKSVYRDRFKVGSNWKYGRCSITAFRGHENGVTCLQISDNIMATGSYDATIKIWDIEKGQELRTLRGHEMGIRTLQFDDTKLISGGLDKTIKVWNWQTGECLNTILGHSEGVISVHFDGAWLASGSIDKTIKIFNFETRNMFCLKGHSDWVNQVRLDLPSRTLFSASDDCTVKLWDLDTKTCIKTLEGHVGQVQQVLLLPEDFEPDEEPSGPGGYRDNTDTLSVASGRSGTPASFLHPTPFAPPAPPAAANGTAATNGLQLFVQAQTPTQTIVPPLSSTTLTTASISPDDYVPTAYGAIFAASMSMSSGASSSSGSSSPSSHERSLPPRYIMTAGLDNTIRLWDTATGRCLRTSFGHVEGIWALSGDTLRVVTGANDAMVKIWEPRSGKCERTFTGHAGPVMCVGLSDSRMASGGEDGEVRMYSFAEGERGASVFAV